jgi:ferritin
MIKKVMEDAINAQVARELYSSNLYLSMAGFYHSLNLTGFANWMRVQAQEEMAHAIKLFDYLLDRGGHAIINEIPAPPSVWDNPLAAFETAYEHEQMVTSWINNLADLAVKEGDHATHILLNWFITEQVEEEASTGEKVERIRMVEGSKAGLFMIDNELKTRIYTPPPPNK